MNRKIHCLSCRCVLYSVVDAARHELQGHNVVSYAYIAPVAA